MHGDGISAVAGIAVHLFFFNRGEHHLYGVRYVQCALCIFIFAVSGLVGFGYSLDRAFFLTTRYGGSFFAGLYGSLLVYRSLLSPLNHFPGPWSARFSSLSLSAQVWRGNAHTKVLGLHQHFGDFVRVGSSDLSIIHPRAVSAIYGRGSRCMKADWYDLTAPLISMQTTRDRQEHDARRRIWAGAFNDTMIRSYEQRLIPYQDKLIIYLLDLDGKPVNVSHLLNLYSYDVMGDLAFGTSFNMLKSDQQHSAIQLLRAALTTLSWNLPMWLFRLLLAVPGATGGWQPFVSYCCERLDERMLVWRLESTYQRKDMAELTRSRIRQAPPISCPFCWILGPTVSSQARK